MGPDPDLFIPNLQGSPGSTVNVSVMLKVTEPDGISLSSFQIFIQFDPSEFTINSATIGSTYAALGNASIVATTSTDVFSVQGGSASGTGTIPFGTDALLFNLSVTVKAARRPGPRSSTCCTTSRTPTAPRRRRSSPMTPT